MGAFIGTAAAILTATQRLIRGKAIKNKLWLNAAVTKEHDGAIRPKG